MADVIEGAQGAALGVCGAKDAAVYAGVDHEAGAHEAGLQRDVDGAAGESPAAEGARCRHHGAELRVGRGVQVQLAAVVGARDHLAVADHHGSDGYLALGRGGVCLGERQAHVLLVVGHVLGSSGSLGVQTRFHGVR